MRRTLTLAAVIVFLVGLATLFSPARTPGGSASASTFCENQICDGVDDCRYLKNAICIDLTWEPCQWDVCLL